MNRRNILFPHLSHQIMACAFEVHNQLGPGFVEKIYEEAMVQELVAQGIQFERQKGIDIFYKGIQIGRHRLDIVVQSKVILELKADSSLADVHKQQTLSYLKATGLTLGILLNFGTPRVQHIRIANSKPNRGKTIK